MRSFQVLVCLVSLLISQGAHAAWPTKVLTAVEKNKKLPDVNLEVTYDFDRKTARITREWIEGGIAQDVKEADFASLTQRLLIDARVGIFRDLEFHLQIPIILRDTSELSFTEDVDASNSTLFGFQNPNANNRGFDYRFPITEIPQSRTRAGFGDMTFGLSWAPLVEHKDEAYPTVTLRGDIVVPTGKRRDPTSQDAITGVGNDVGRHQTVIDLSIGVSKQMRTKVPTLDPYMLFGAQIPIATSTQRTLGMEPSITGRFKVGTEIVLYRQPKDDAWYSLDLSFGLRYTSQGRTYSELSDYLPNFNQQQPRLNRPSDSTLPIDSVLYDDYNNPLNYNTSIVGAQCIPISAADGVTLANVPCGELNRVEEHMRMSGAIVLNLRPTRWFLIRTGFTAGFTTDHLLTTEPVGTDTDPDSAIDQTCDGADCVGRVNARNSLGQDERSPYYDPRYDQPGRRLRIEEVLNLSFFVTAAATF